MADQLIEPGTDAARLGITTQPERPDISPGQPRLGAIGWLRWTWRQLTSMRTALLLLFLLAIGSVPGSLLPQRSTDPVLVTQYLKDHPGWGAVYNKLGLMDVFAAPWFAAIFVMLCISVAGCVIPRARLHWKAMRAQPPAAPSRLSRMPESTSWLTDASGRPAQEVLDETATELRSRRWRVNAAPFDGSTGWVSAEKGYLRESGNLLFHVSLLVLLIAVASGAMLGWKGQVLVIEGQGFADTITQYDTFKSGRLVHRAELPPFSFTLDDFSASYEADGEHKGSPTDFRAKVNYKSDPDAVPQTQTIAVNSPLNIDGSKVFMIGHGYAPKIQVRDSKGVVIYDAPTVFLPRDGNFTSDGVVKMPDVEPQLGLQGIFAPTGTISPTQGPISTFPAPDNPMLFASAWQGNLGLDNGIPQSVYSLDVTQLKRIGLRALNVGDTWKLPKNAGTVTLTGFSEYGTFDVAHDPGKGPALLAAVLAILGLMLSLFIPRRRVWVRISDMADGRNRVEVAGLSRTDETGLAPAVAQVAALVSGMATPIQPNPQGTLTPASSDQNKAQE